MQFEMPLSLFYSHGYERRFFHGLREIPAVREFRRVGGKLILEIEVRFLNRVSMHELLALLWRYSVPLNAFKALAMNNRRFSWLRDEEAYWYPNMFEWREE